MLNKSANTGNGTFTRLGDLPGATKRKKGFWSRVPWLFVSIVVIPTLIAAIYFGIFARPVYVAEAQFVVRSQRENTPNALGMALQGIGLSTSSSDSFLAHSYLKSRYALEAVSKNVEIQNIIPSAGNLSKERLYKAFQKRIVVGVNSSDGISTLRVRAYDASTAQDAANIMLDGAENVINDLNERSSAKTLVEAQETFALAEQQLQKTTQAVAEFRRINQTVDPVRMATESGQLLGGLMLEIAQAKAERATIASGSPSSPMLPQLDAQIRALETQLQSERAALSSGTNSVASQISTYEDLVLQREIAERALTAAKASLEEAAVETRRQKLYLDRIVPPQLPDEATEPRRLYSIFLTLLSVLLVYGVVALLWASVREHKQS
ncbi:chain-length determining protein [Brevundimonas sp.]|uniref:chain-length determining protein n=1 Tax=Brevundimonas sp. TaxID=1871086 RepID=UPI0028986E92|nr:chain-length determining protein [Brevundimonas sp.]